MRRRGIAPAGHVQKLTLDSQLLKNNFLGDPSAKVALEQFEPVDEFDISGLWNFVRKGKRRTGRNLTAQERWVLVSVQWWILKITERRLVRGKAIELVGDICADVVSHAPGDI